MTCSTCGVVRQLALNAAVWFDKTLNLLLLGTPNETVSIRLERARAAGESWAVSACAVLTWIGARLGSKVDHCTWAADTSSGSIAAEVWHWSLPSGNDA